METAVEFLKEFFLNIEALRDVFFAITFALIGAFYGLINTQRSRRLALGNRLLSDFKSLRLFRFEGEKTIVAVRKLGVESLQRSVDSIEPNLLKPNSRRVKKLSTFRDQLHRYFSNYQDYVRVRDAEKEEWKAVARSFLDFLFQLDSSFKKLVDVREQEYLIDLNHSAPREEIGNFESP